MIDWNYILNQVATVAFDIIYFGAIIGTIVVIILDNRNPVKPLAWILVPACCGVSILFLFRTKPQAGAHHRAEDL